MNTTSEIKTGNVCHGSRSTEVRTNCCFLFFAMVLWFSRKVKSLWICQRPLFYGLCGQVSKKKKKAKKKKRTCNFLKPITLLPRLIHPDQTLSLLLRLRPRLVVLDGGACRWAGEGYLGLGLRLLLRLACNIGRRLCLDPYLVEEFPLHLHLATPLGGQPAGWIILDLSDNHTPHALVAFITKLSLFARGARAVLAPLAVRATMLLVPFAWPAPLPRGGACAFRLANATMSRLGCGRCES